MCSDWLILLLPNSLCNTVVIVEMCTTLKIIQFLGFFKIHPEASCGFVFYSRFQFFGLPEKFVFCGLRPFVSSQSISKGFGCQYPFHHLPIIYTPIFALLHWMSRFDCIFFSCLQLRNASFGGCEIVLTNNEKSLHILQWKISKYSKVELRCNQD